MAATDILTLEEGKQAIAVLSSDDRLDDVVARMIGAVTNRIDKNCGPVVIRTVTETRDGGCSTLELARRPVVSVTSVTESYINGTTVALDATGWKLRSGGRLVRVSSGYPVWFLDGDITVVYEAGRFASTDEVEMDWKHGAAEILGEVFTQNAPRWARSPNLPTEGEEPNGYLAIDAMIRTRFPLELNRAPTMHGGW